MKTLLFILTASLMGIMSYGQSKSGVNSNVVGKVFRNIDELPQFKDYKEEQGVLLEPTEQNYCLEVIGKGTFKVLLLNECIPTNSKVKYRILDTVIVGNVPKNQVVITTLCRINRRNNTNIIAVVKPDGKEFYKKVYKAWIVNKATLKLEKINVKGIDCLNEGFDL